MNGSPPAAGNVAEEARAWTEVFTLFQQSGQDDRGAAYAMGMGSLRQKSEELSQDMEALQSAERELLELARREAKEAAADADMAADLPDASRAWGEELVGSLASQAQQASAQEFAREVPSRAARLAQEAHQDAMQHFPPPQGGQAAPGEQVDAAERMALRAQGLNCRRLPLRPGHPPCGFYMRRGDCKRGRTCIWDHPEQDSNSQGYPLRPGQPPCALYCRTQACKFGAICAYDHPEPACQAGEQPGALPLALAAAAARQHQLQLLLHLQLMQEHPDMQDPAAMMNAWVRFRVTFASQGG
mmetsp:Transcript_22421/g.62955  ORF Transcript_22421/g.62955 Transcript_22421/m.62955 type:complete len:300 (-) Transcript_22421:27-926(-)